MKISIIWTWMVWSTFAYRLLTSWLADEIVLIDVNKERAEWEVLDMLSESPTKIYSADFDWARNSDVVVITAWLPRKDGETRLDLINKNLTIFKEMIPNITKYAPNSKYVLISNPVDVMTYATIKYWNLDPKNVIWTWTMLDTMRFKAILGKYFSVNPGNINAFVVGEHGDSQVALYHSANVNGIQIDDFANQIKINFDDEIKKNLTQETKTCGAQIIKKKIATYYGIWSGTFKIVETIVKNELSLLPVSTMMKMDQIWEICTSLPTKIWRNWVEKVFWISMNQDEKKSFDESSKILKWYCDLV